MTKRPVKSYQNSPQDSRSPQLYFILENYIPKLFSQRLRMTPRHASATQRGPGFDSGMAGSKQTFSFENICPWT